MRSSAPARRPRATSVVKSTVENVRVAVPQVDFASIAYGAKEMYRTYALRVKDLALPMPVVIYTEDDVGEIKTAVVALVETRQEPLGVISPADVAAEGFDELGDFKRYWLERYPMPRGYRPLDKVQVYRFEPLDDDVVEAWKSAAFAHVLGRWAR